MFPLTCLSICGKYRLKQNYKVTPTFQREDTSSNISILLSCSTGQVNCQTISTASPAGDKISLLNPEEGLWIEVGCLGKFWSTREADAHRAESHRVHKSHSIKNATYEIIFMHNLKQKESTISDAHLNCFRPQNEQAESSKNNKVMQQNSTVHKFISTNK